MDMLSYGNVDDYFFLLKKLSGRIGYNFSGLFENEIMSAAFFSPSVTLFQTADAVQ